jgi:diaminohydroxyphosphoribosylaminopyrimidine deaminase/5-amino-6-(5-phosphoribosylamino)uracil reductase
MATKHAREDEKFMRLALREAERGVGRTSPNPAVGAVIVRGGRILARGHHRQAGLPHAEIEALSKVRKTPAATLYVTLEPCSTHGRTPPCVDAIIAAGIRRVVIGAIDPNPAHAGRAVAILRRARIAVSTGVLESECRELNKAFNKWIVTKTPYVIAKAGITLDGRITRPRSEGRWITGPAARARAMRLRAEVDAILIGSGTLRDDNPRLTVRGIRGVKQPWRVLMTRSGKLPSKAHVFTDEHRDRTLIYKNKSLRFVLRDLGRRKVTSVLIEGGMRLLGEAFDRGVVDEVCFHIAPLLTGGPKFAVGGNGVPSNELAIRIANPRYEKTGPDLCLRGFVNRGQEAVVLPRRSAAVPGQRRDRSARYRLHV